MTLPLTDFFEFGPEQGDSTAPPNDDSSVGPLALPHVFAYFDNNHRQIWVANNGLFSFLSPISQFTPDPFPLANDSRLVAGFWADIDTRGTVSGTGNKVYYQIYHDTLSSNITLPVFTKASGYVRSFFPQERLLEPKMVITATWYRVGVYSLQTDRLNTFQIVLTTDRERSFVFFLYHDLQWAGTSNTTIPRYAQAGFNAGDGITSTMLPHSRTKDIVRLVNESNVNVPGLFAFRVDTDKIDAGGCSANVSVASFRPRMSSQLGSTTLHLQGPCFTNETKVKCRFGFPPQAVNGLVIDEFRAMCLTPFAYVHGSVPVSVSINDGENYTLAGTFTYAPLRFGSDDVMIETEDRNNLLNVSQYINLTWHFSESTRNLFPNGTTVDIELWKVNLQNQSKLQLENSPVMLAQGLDSVNSARIRLPESIAFTTTCFIRVVARFESQTYAGLNTGLLTVRSHPTLAPELCIEWARRQPDPSTWNKDTLLPCPMTRWQAQAAGRCCYESDGQCSLGNPNPTNCQLRQGRTERDELSAVECYLSTIPNAHGAGTECCYDVNGTIITRGTGAGTDDRYRPASSPILHYFDDSLPYLQCCVMSTNAAMCDRYMINRPPRAGSNTMGENGGTWGDPHFVTLDGTSYTFNGYGEYVYLAITNASSLLSASNATDQNYTFMSHIRTVPLSSNDVTVVKGFAARSNHPEAKSVSITVSRRDQLIIYRDNERLEFEDNMNTLYFPELTIERNRDNDNMFTLSWTVGITIRVNSAKIQLPSEILVLNVAASVAGLFRGRTYGLLGTYDGLAANDLQNRNGKVLYNNASLEQIHKEFGVTWAINPSTSLFHYESDQSAEFFKEQNERFLPSFTEPINSPTRDASIRKACNININSSSSTWNVGQRTCYYDSSITNNTDFGKMSLVVGDELLSIKLNQRNPPLFTSLPLRMQAKDGDQVQLIIRAASEYPSHATVMSALHLPQYATFNGNTSQFKWQAIKGDHYVRIQARDTTYNLASVHEIAFQVTPKDSANQFGGQMILFSIVGLVLFCK